MRWRFQWFENPTFHKLDTAFPSVLYQTWMNMIFLSHRKPPWWFSLSVPHELLMSFLSVLLYSKQWDTEKYKVRYFPYLRQWRYRSRDHFPPIALCLQVVIRSKNGEVCEGDYIIKRTLHGGLKIWILSSRGENNILLTRCTHW